MTRRSERRMLAPIAVLAMLTLGLDARRGTGVQRLPLRAAEQLLQPDGYVRAVLGGR